MLTVIAGLLLLILDRLGGTRDLVAGCLIGLAVIPPLMWLAHRIDGD
jgi:hypothetical protein